MKRTNKKKYSIVLFTLILALGVIAGAYALLSDTVTLTGSATVVESETNVGLEITSVEEAGAGTDAEGGYSAYQPTFSLSEDKKTITFSLGEIKVDESGNIIGVDDIVFEETPGWIGAQYDITIKNTGNVPIQFSRTTQNAGLTFELVASEDQEPIYSNEILAPNSTCSFYLLVKTTDTTYTSGTTLTGSYTINATDYTGTETPLESHNHYSGGYF